MLLKTRLLKIQKILSLMLKDLLEENSMMMLFRRIWNIGHSKLSAELMINQWLKFNSKERPKDSIQNKFLLWFLLKWKRLLRIILVRKSKMLLLLSLLISMTLKDKPLKMLVLLLVSMLWELSMNQLLLLLLTDLIRM